jgi:uncharacterized repeat protein (TIGR03837 family)
MWMAPQHQEFQDLSLLAWPSQTNADLWQLKNDLTWIQPACVIEAFGCEIPQVYLAHVCSIEEHHQTSPEAPSDWVWINLEYLSAEDYPQRQHQLASPVMHGAAKGKVKWFFYPGFTSQTGGLLKKLETPIKDDSQTEPKHQNSLKWDPDAQLKIFLFSYEPQALTQLILDLSALETPVHLKVSSGRSEVHVKRTLETTELKAHVVHSSDKIKRLRQLNIEFIQAIDHPSFDALLASSDLNFVRGEDSWVRAIWAQKPFIWQIYPQDDGVHLQKMNAFLNRFNAPQSLEKAFRAWNGFEPSGLPQLTPEVLSEWGLWSHQLANELMAMPDLADQLCDFLALKLQQTDAQKL